MLRPKVRVSVGLKRCTAATLLLLIIGGFPAAVMAQNGKGLISGRAVDTAGAVLQGAKVEVQPGGIIAASDRQGEFSINDLPPGSYRLKISYVGFLPYSSTLKVIGGQPTNVEAVLKIDGKGEQIFVTADRPHGEAEAINRQRTADNIIDVLPSDVIRSLPNANIADAVGRLPGVTLERDEGEGKYVQIRGTEPRLNNTTIDGVDVPAPEDNVRQVKLDTIPSGIVEAVEVNKTLSANQDANAIGGTVNLRTKTAGELPTLTVEGFGGFSPIVNTRYVDEFTGTVGERFGASKKFGALFSGSFDYNGRGIDDIEPQPDPNFATPYYDSMDLREYRYFRTRWGVAGSLDYKLKEGSGLFLRYFYSDFKDYGDKWVYSLSDAGAPQFSTSSRLPDYGIFSLALGGKHVLTDWWFNWELSVARSRQLAAAGNPGATFSFNPNNPFVCNYDPAATTNIHLPQFNAGCTAPGSPTFDPSQYQLTEYDATKGTTSQVNLQGALAVGRNYHLGSHFSTFEFGFKERNEHKGQDAYSAVYDQAFLPTPAISPMTQYLSGFHNSNYYSNAYNFGPVTDYNKIVANLNNVINQGVLSLDLPATTFGSAASNFDLTERVSAAYAMNTIEFGRFRLQTGLRFEATQLDILGYLVTNNADSTASTVTPEPANNWYWDALPSVQLRYSLGSDTDVRAVYGRGIARPNPYDLVPYVTLDQSSNPYSYSIGNPALKPEHANNCDLLFEQYLKPFGLIQAGVFYKQLSDPIYYINNPLVASGPYAGYQLASVINGSSAQLYGFEAAYIQHLGFLPGPLNGFGLSANYTWTNSSAGTLPLRTDNAKLQRQSPTTWNFSPTYDKGRFSGRLGLTYNGASIYQYQWQQRTNACVQNTNCEDPAGLGTKGPAGDNYLYSHLQVDAQASIRVTKSLSALVQGLNLTDEVFGFYNGSPQYVVQREYYKPTYTFGLRWEPRRE